MLLFLFTAIGVETDFVSTTQVLTFSPSQLPRQAMAIQIAIVDDNLVESTENLDGVLTLTTTEDVINLQPSVASISIIDNDGMHIITHKSLTYFNDHDILHLDPCLLVRWF